MSKPLRLLLLSAACGLALQAFAQDSTGSSAPITIPAGDLASALDTLARQSGIQLVYSSDQLRGTRTSGVRSAPNADAALQRLLRDSGFAPRRDAASGAIVIVRGDTLERAAEPAPESASPGGAAAATTPPPEEFEVVHVTGSRIPRSRIEGPAPVTIIGEREIRAGGFVSVPDVLRAITQNNGETQSQQSASGADFSPGAQQVDLRGLGPNHTLVLVNGRRIADFPMPFQGRSNFTDISSIPLGMVDRVEVLTGSASAVYGSDAISGVVNFILKKQADGTTVDVRYGDTTRGGGESYDVSLTTGFERDGLHAVIGAELQVQRPLWAYDRATQDSTLDGPTARSQAARRAFLRTNYDDEYLDPGQAACDALSSLNHGSTGYSSRPGFGPYDPILDDYGPGYYCGSDKAIGYGTILSERKGINAYGAFNYTMQNGHQWFADVQLGYHKIGLFRDVNSWSYQAPDGNEDGYFYNQATGQVEYWQRQFSPEEMGGLDRGMIRSTQKTFGIATGFTGPLGGNWDYEATLSHSQYHAAIRWPQIVAGAANDLFLGPQLGTDPDGLPIFDADPSRLYTPLTRAQYDAISGRSTYRPTSRTDTVSLTLTNPDLFQMPAGAAGFAGIVEFGNQAYDLHPDTRATEYYYYSWKDSDGHGSRNRWAVAGELRAPLHETVNASLAARYDQYRYSGHSVGKPTWSAGLEWRPIESLLVRGSYGTAFRAADLHYIYAGLGNDETSGIDYYACLSDDPGATDCSDYDAHLIRTRQGNRSLDPETSTSWTAGLVWSPSHAFDVSLDYFDIRMRNQVQDMSVGEILRDEARCRLGDLDPASPTCVDALGRVARVNGDLYGVHVNPINVARENTSGVDLSAHYKLETVAGDFRFGLDHSWVRRHEFQRYSGDPVENELAVNSGFDIPRTKTSLSAAWNREQWSAGVHGQRLGKLPTSDSYDQVYDPADGDSPWVGATWRWNLTAGYRINDTMRIGLAIDNLFDKMPPKDRTYTAYPYYDVSWFDTIGRTVYLDFLWTFGGNETP